MSNLICHPYHMVDESPWPLFGAVGGLYLTMGIVSWFHLNSILLFLLSLLLLSLVIFQWWRDICREGAIQGLHTSITELGLRWGIALFIISEIFFFLRFFWAFFHRRLSPNVEVGSIWPPFGIQVFNPIQLSLLNTTVLVSSRIRTIWDKYAPMFENYAKTFQELLLKVMLGIYLTVPQGRNTTKPGLLLQTGYTGLHFYYYKIPRITWFS